MKPFNYPKSRELKPSELLSVYKTLRKANGHQRWWPGDTRFEIILGAILTQNTSWTNVEKAIRNLKKSGCLSINGIHQLSEKRLAALIRPAGYFNIKAKRIKNFMRFLFQNFNGNLTRMFAASQKNLRTMLLAVNGIGPETADSILLYAGQKSIFVIDAYTKRIFARHRLGRIHGDYSAWQKLFMDSLPRRTDLYNDYHAQIVHTGKHFCRSLPKCSDCPLKSYL